MIKNENKMKKSWKIAIFHFVENFGSTGSTNDKNMIKNMKKTRKIAIFHFLENVCTAGSKNDEQ